LVPAFNPNDIFVEGWPLPQAPFVAAVAEEQRQVGIPIVRPVAVPMMHFHDVLYHEAWSAKRTTVLLSLQQPDHLRRFRRIAP
jgi:hypothetical protein